MLDKPYNVKNYTMDLHLYKLEECTSTNSVVKELLLKGNAEEGLLVVSDYQSSGRGQGFHAWHSRPGENLLMSLLVQPEFLSASDQFLLSVCASLAICDFLESKSLDSQIKWPNDILVSGSKIAGILIEHGIRGERLDHTIIGIGLNINQADFPDFPVKATSVAKEKGDGFPPGEAAPDIGRRIRALYNLLSSGDHLSLEKRYRQRMWMIDREIRYSCEGETQCGIVRGVNRSGELLLETEGRMCTFMHGEAVLHVHF